MKTLKFSLLICSLVLFNSCGKNYIGIFETQADNIELIEEEYAYEKDSILIDYDFWANNGQLQFTIHNLSDRPVYIDWQRSHFIEHGYSHDYYSAIENYTEVLSHNPDEGTIIEESVHRKPLPYIQLPPHSYIYINKFGLNPSLTIDTKMKNRIKRTEYTKENSIYSFRNYISYSFDKDLTDLKVADTEFWISRKYEMKETVYNEKFKANVTSFKNKFYKKTKTEDHFIAKVAQGVGTLALVAGVVYVRVQLDALEEEE